MERGGYRMTTTGDESQAVEQAGGENLTKAEGEMKIAPKVIPHPSIEERAHRGREARKKVTRASHGGWAPAGDRPDPDRAVAAEDERHGRWRAGRRSGDFRAIRRKGNCNRAADAGTRPSDEHPSS